MNPDHFEHLQSRITLHYTHCVLCSVDRASLYNLVNKANLVTVFLSVFLSFLHMFRATMCPSSGETAVFMGHVVLGILYG